MKTKFYILLALLTLNFSFLFAGSPEKSVIRSGEKMISLPAELVSLSPSAPREATFTDIDQQLMPIEVQLAPETPKEAKFDEAPQPTDYSKLAPATPKEADFE